MVRKAGLEAISLYQMKFSTFMLACKPNMIPSLTLKEMQNGAIP